MKNIGQYLNYCSSNCTVTIRELLAELKATESRLHEVSTFCATVEQQRDDLLSILQRLKAVDFGEHWSSDAEQAAIAARALITKFEVESVK